MAEDFDTWRLSEVGQDSRRRICGGAVYDNEFSHEGIGLHTLDDLAESALLVVERHDYGELHCRSLPLDLEGTDGFARRSAWRSSLTSEKPFIFMICVPQFIVSSRRAAVSV